MKISNSNKTFSNKQIVLAVILTLATGLLVFRFTATESSKALQRESARITDCVDIQPSSETTTKTGLPLQAIKTEQISFNPCVNQIGKDQSEINREKLNLWAFGTWQGIIDLGIYFVFWSALIALLGKKQKI